MDAERFKIRFPGQVWINLWKITANDFLQLPPVEVAYSYFGSSSTRAALYSKAVWSISAVVPVADVALLKRQIALMTYNRQNRIDPYHLQWVDRTRTRTEVGVVGSPSLTAYDTPIDNGDGTITYTPQYEVILTSNLDVVEHGKDDDIVTFTVNQR